MNSLGYISSVSLGSVGALFILSEYSFSKGGDMSKLDAIVFAILFCGSFLWIYEVIYHFSFPPDLSSNEITQLGNGARYLATAALPIFPILLLRKRLALTRISAVLGVVFALMWILWFLYGFPQYYMNHLVYSPSILKNTDPWHTSLFFNFGSKTVLAVFFASILKIPYRNEARDLLRKARILK